MSCVLSFVYLYLDKWVSSVLKLQEQMQLNKSFQQLHCLKDIVLYGYNIHLLLIKEIAHIKLLTLILKGIYSTTIHLYV